MGATVGKTGEEVMFDVGVTPVTGGGVRMLVMSGVSAERPGILIRFLLWRMMVLVLHVRLVGRWWKRSKAKGRIMAAGLQATERLLKWTWTY